MVIVVIPVEREKIRWLVPDKNTETNKGQNNK